MSASKTGLWVKRVFLPVALVFALPSTLSGQGGVDISISTPEPSAPVVPAGAKLSVGYHVEILTEQPRSSSSYSTSFNVSTYLSNDAQISTDDLRLGRTGTSLGAFLESASSRVTTYIPGDTAPGTYFLGVCATEIEFPDTNPSNNCTNPGASIEIVDADAAELEILYGSIRFGSTITNPGETLESILRIQNHGTVSAGSFEVKMIWRRILRGYASDIDPKLQSLAKVDGGIAPGESMYADIDIAIPDDATPGQYALAFCIDSANEIPERDETNNCRSSSRIVIDGPHDLRITKFEIGQSSDVILVAHTIVNKPHYQDYAPPVLTLFYSLDPVISPDDPEVDHWRVLFGDPYDPVFSGVARRFHWPPELAPGLYYLGICVDWLDFIKEENEENNCASAPFTVPELSSSRAVEIEAMVLDHSDASPGETVNVSVVLRNNASFVIPPVRLSVHIFFGRVIECNPYPNFTLESEEFPPHSVQKITGSFVVPSPPFTYASHYTFASVAVCGVRGPFENYYLGYDGVLQALYIIYPSDGKGDIGAGVGLSTGELVRGVPFELTVTTRSDRLHYISIPTTTSVLLSTDRAVDSTDLEIYRTHVPPLRPDTRREITVLSTLPDDVEPGTYYIAACADIYDEVDEEFENDCLSPVTVTVTDAPPSFADLVVTGARVNSNTVQSGEHITLEFSMMNRGNQAAVPWHDGALRARIRWHQTSSVNRTDTYERIKYAIKTTKTLGAGENRSFTVSLPVPNYFTTGLHFLSVCADGPEELNRHNNCEDIAVWVESPVRFDFQVADYTIQFPETPGKPLQITFRAVESEGHVPRGEWLYGSVLWSADARIDEDDQVIGTAALGGLGPEPNIVTGPILVELPDQAGRAGSYLAICVNHGEYRYFVEVNEGNNCAVIPISVDGEAEPGISELAFNLSNGGASSWLSSSDSGSSAFGYARIHPEGGSTTPFGLAIFGYRENGILISEAGVPATRLVSGGRIYAEVGGALNTGLAIANPNDVDAAIRFYFTDAKGINSGSGSFELGAHEQTAKFLDQEPFNGGGSVSGTFTFTSSVPIAVTALRGLTNEDGEFLMTTLPVAPLSSAATDTLYFPQFADGSGWVTQLILVNPTDSTITGMVGFIGPGSGTAAASPATLTLDDGRTGSNFEYSIPPRSSQRFTTSNPPGRLSVGSVRATPSRGTPAPSGLAVFSYASGGKTLSEAGVPALPKGSAFRTYVEASGTPGQAGSTRSGLAITNTAATSNTVSLEVTRLDGSLAVPPATLVLPPSGQAARFIDEIFPLPDNFSGVLRATSTADVAIIGLRLRVNGNNELKMTTTSPSNEMDPSTSEDRFFAHLADSGGWSTQFILFSGTAGQTASEH